MSTLNPRRQSKLSARGPGEILFPDTNVPQPCPFNPIVSSRPPRTLANMVHRFFCSLHYKTPALDVMISGLVQDVHTCQLLHPTKQIENHFYLCIRMQIGPLILPPAWLGMYGTKAISETAWTASHTSPNASKTPSHPQFRDADKPNATTWQLIRTSQSTQGVQ